MKKRLYAVVLVALACLSLLSVLSRMGVKHGTPRQSKVALAALRGTSSSKGTAPRQRITPSYGQLPLSFEVNQGQTDQRVKFISRGSGYSLFLTPTEAVLSLNRNQAPRPEKLAKRAAPASQRKSTPAVLRMKLLGANPQPQVVGAEELSGKSNYFIGNDPKKWRTNVAHYGKVKYRQVYPGVDLVYYGNQRQLEYDFIVAPGADPKPIRLGFAGAEKVRVDGRGDLVCELASGDVRWHKPVVYQEEKGVRQPVAARYEIKDKHQVGFRLAAYDPRKPLIIDPVLSYSTYLGGTSTDAGYGIAVDGAGNTYITGNTESTNYPTQNPLQAATNTVGGSDVFVTKINASGSALVYSTYLGGSNSEQGTGIAVDSQGNAYVTGSTTSINFPLQNPLQASSSGYNEAFVAKLNAAGSALVYSTYLGGSSGDRGSDIAVDGAGNACVTGYTESVNFPLQNPFQSTYRRGDAFVTKLNAAGSALIYSTYLGSSGWDVSGGIAVSSSFIYVTGNTNGGDFPTSGSTPSGSTKSFQIGRASSSDASSSDTFVVKLQTDVPGSLSLAYSTYLGGSDGDYGYDVAVDSQGNAYVTGVTWSSNFPLRAPVQAAYGSGRGDAFVTKLNTNATGDSSLIYSTYLGGAADDTGRAIAVSGQEALVTGYTTSSNFPTRSALQPELGSQGGGISDVFVSRLNSSGSGFVYSTYLGGSSRDYGYGIAVDNAGSAYVTGATQSANFPTANPFQAAYADINAAIMYDDAFISKISPASASAPTITGFWPTNGPPGTNVTITGTNFVAGETSVDFRLTDARIVGSVTPTSITAVVPSVATTGTIGVGTPGGFVRSTDVFTVTAPRPANVVTNTNDSGIGSLREVILFSNSNPGKDTISFDIPGTGVQSIQPRSPLPTITDPVVIDGYTQPGANPNTLQNGNNAVLKIELNGNGLRAANGLTISAGNSIVRGLAINRFDYAGIQLDTQGGNVIEGNYLGTGSSGTLTWTGGSYSNVRFGVWVKGSGNMVGGTTPAARNLISACREDGVRIDGSGATGNQVCGNYIGTNKSGTAALGNRGWGIIISRANNNMIGGATAGSGNLISGNTHGVYIYGYGTGGSGGNGNRVQGNYIGTNVTGATALANKTTGVIVDSGQSNLIGGASPGQGNLISGNGQGIQISGANNVVQGNFIGTSADGLGLNPNRACGVEISGQSNSIGGVVFGAGNRIAFNGTDGVKISDAASVRNSIRGNSIFSNGGLGINLASSIEQSFSVTANDTGDGDTGVNNLQNFPVITSAIVSGSGVSSTVMISGTLNSTPNTTFALDFYSNIWPLRDRSGYGEGQTFVGSTNPNITTDASGNASFTFTATGDFNDRFFTATANNLATGDTSEFSTVPIRITGFSPAAGPPGTVVTIIGAGFSGATAVQFNGETATPTVDSDAQITATVPSGATTGRISVQAPAGTAPSHSDFVVTSGPLNDDFKRAEILRGSSGQARGTNVGATRESGEPNHGETTNGHSVWYYWTAPVDGHVTFNTTGSSFDTVFAIYKPSLDGGGWNGLERNPIDTVTTSGLTFTANKTQSYYIAVDGIRGAQGSLVLNWAIAGSPPVNDNFNFVNAQLPTIGSSSSGRLTGTNVRATRETGEPNHGNASARASVWYKFDSRQMSSGSLTLDTIGSKFDTVLAVYRANVPASPTVDELTLIACNDDAGAGSASSVTFDHDSYYDPGNFYYIAIDGVAGDEGDIFLNWKPGVDSRIVRWNKKDTAGNGSSGNWSTAANWIDSSGVQRVPGSTDQVIIDLPGTYTVTLDQNAVVASLTLGAQNTATGTQTLEIRDYSLALNGASSITPTGLLSLSGGTLTTHDNLVITGILRWTGGTLSGKGNRYINPGGLLDISGTADKLIAQGTVTNYGTTNWGGTGRIRGNPGVVFDNYAVFNLSNGIVTGFAASIGATFNNNGGIIAGAGTIEGSVRNTGVLRVELPTVTVNNRAATRAVSTSSAPVGTIMNITGDLGVQDGGVVETTINSTGYGQFSVVGKITINSGSTLQANVSASSTFPASGDRFEILKGTSINGDFTTKIGLDLPEGARLSTNISPNNLNGMSYVLAMPNPALSLSISPNAITEGGAATGTVQRSGATTTAVTVSLSASVMNQVVIPATVTIPEGALKADFSISAVDDLAVDGSPTVTMNAAAPNFISGNASLTVNDNDIVSNPVNVNVSPNSGSSLVNAARTLAAQYNDPNGAADLAETRLLVQTSINGANALYVYYNRSTNLMYLADNAGTTWLGGFAPGSTNADGSACIVSNSQGSLNVTASSTSVAADGKTLTVNYSLTPAATFTGTKNVYLYTRDKSNLVDGWDALGTWAITVPAAPPVNVSVSPNSGSSLVNAVRTLAAQYDDANGATDLAETHLLVNSSINGANALYVYYNRGTNLMYLRNNAGTGWLGGFAPGSTNADGSARIIRDVDAQGNLIGQGSLNITASSTSVAADSKTLTVNYNLTPAATFTGTKNVYLYTRDKSNLVDGWDSMGTWAITVPAAPPVNVSVSPNSGSSLVNAVRTLAAQYNDPNGATDLAETRLLVSGSGSGANALYVYYNRGTNLMYLADNAGTGWLGGFAPGSTNADGSARIVSNSQGSLNVSASSTSVAADGKTLTVNYSLTPAATFSGTKNIYLYTRDKSNRIDGWDALGSWAITVPAAPPVNVSVSPSSGSSVAGAARTLAAQYNDPNGATDLAETRLLVSGSGSGANALYVYYNRGTNLMYLADNAGTGWLGGFAPGSTNADGSARIVSNSQGSLNVSASSTSVAADGKTLTVNYSLTPAATFSGTKNIYLYTRDKSNRIDGWDALGSWTVTSALTTARVATASPVRLSSAGARMSSQSVLITFTGALDATVASDAKRYSVEVNGVAVEVESAIYSAGSNSVILNLAGDALEAGDSVVACWNELRDKHSALLSGCSGSLTAR